MPILTENAFRRPLLWFCLLAGLAGLSGPALAQQPSPRSSEASVGTGVASSETSRWEDAAALARLEQAVAEDGTLSPDDAFRLMSEMDGLERRLRPDGIDIESRLEGLRWRLETRAGWAHPPVSVVLPEAVRQVPNRAEPVALAGADHCEDAPLIGPGTYSGLLMGTADGTSSCDLVDSAPDVWYRFEEQDLYELFAILTSQDFGPALSFHRHCPDRAQHELACNAGTAGSGLARLKDSLSGSEPVWVRIAGTLSGQGSYTLDIGRGAEIEGVVLDEATGAPIVGARVSLHSQTGSSTLGSATSDADGRYRMPRLWNDSYRLSVRAEGFVAEIFDDVVCEAGDSDCRDVAGRILEPGLNETGRADFVLSRGGEISGRVTSAVGGEPVEASIFAYNEDGYSAAQVDTEEDGTYRMAGLPNGSYRLQALASGRFVDLLWPDIPCHSNCDRQDGDPVTVTEGQIRSGIDFSLLQLGTLAGTVRDNRGQAVASASVAIRRTDGSSFRSVRSDSDGRWEHAALDAGSYLISASARRHLDQLYPQTTCPPQGCDWSSGTVLTVGLDERIDDLDFNLVLGGTLSGRVTHGVTGEPVPSVTVSGRRTDGFGGAGSVTDSDGFYTLSGLADGEFKVFTEAQGLGFLNVVYPDLICDPQECPVEQGQAIPVLTGQDTLGIDMQVRGLGSIQGRVLDAATGRPIAGARLGLDFGNRGLESDADGRYAFTNVYPGIHTVQVSHPDYVDETYDGVPCYFFVRTADDCELTGRLPTEIEVAVEQNVDGIDVTLDAGARIRGRVRTATGAPVGPGVRIQVLDSRGRELGSFAVDDESGLWSSGALPPGTYHARTRTAFTPYENIVWNGRLCPEPDQDCPRTGDPITLDAARDTDGIDFVLRIPGIFRGQVTDADTGAPVDGAVAFWNGAGERVLSVLLDGDGRFETDDIRPGTYYMTAHSNDGHVDRVYGGGACLGEACDPTTGTAIRGEYDRTVDGLDMRLTMGGQIAGSLLPSIGTLDSRDVFLFDGLGRQLQKDSVYQGRWSFGGLTAGTYFVVAEASQSFYAQVWQGGHCRLEVCDPTSGTPVVLTDRGVVTGIDFNLAAYGKISGQVTRKSNGAPLSGVAVQLWREDRLRLELATDEDGRFLFSIDERPHYVSTRSGDWVDLVWPETPCPGGICQDAPAQGEAIYAGPEEQITNIDFALQPSQSCDHPDGLCLGGGRFRVLTIWGSESEPGSPRLLTADTGYFSFFNPSNVEVLVKILDGCAINGHFWIFAAGLTDLETELVVEDRWTGQVRRVSSPSGRAFQPVQDIEAFATCDAAPNPRFVETGLALQVPPVVKQGDLQKACAGSDSAACLTGGRFQVEVDWQTGSTPPSPAQAELLTSDTAYFWFFEPSNVEVLVKVLNACSNFGQFWVFTSGLTDVGTELRITDTETGASWTRQNPSGTPYAPEIDIAAFECP